MDVQVEQLEDSRIRVRLEIPGDEIDEAVMETAIQLGKQVRVPGFRKGKVPAIVALRHIGRDTVIRRMLSDRIDAWWADAIATWRGTTVGRPYVNVDEPLPGPGEPLSAEVEIAIWPMARLGRYKGLDVERREPCVREQDVDAELAVLRDRHAVLETVERPAQTGDFVVVDYEESDVVQRRDWLVELGTGATPALEEAMVGCRVGERRVFDEWRAATLRDVKVKQTPTFEVALESAGFESAEDWREQTVAELRAKQQREIDREFEHAALAAAEVEAEIELPDALLDARVEEMMDERFGELRRQGVPWEAYLAATELDEDGLRASLREDAERAFLRDGVLMAVVKAEGIEPSDAEVAAALTPDDADEVTPAGLVAELRDDGRLERFRGVLARKQAVELLVAEAKPVALAAAR